MLIFGCVKLTALIFLYTIGGYGSNPAITYPVHYSTTLRRVDIYVITTIRATF